MNKFIPLPWKALQMLEDKAHVPQAFPRVEIPPPQGFQSCQLVCKHKTCPFLNEVVTVAESQEFSIHSGCFFPFYGFPLHSVDCVL